jgi:lactate dehydrogenase-like 2-hydroxyacid dehydrogenase
MKPEILLVCPIHRPLMAALDATYEVHRLWEAPDPAALLKAVGGRLKALATSGHTGVAKTVLDALPKVEIIACFGVGYDGVDIDDAKRRGIAVTNTPDVLTEEVADLAITLLLATAREIVRADRFVRRGEWRKGPMPLAHRLAGRRLGIVGLGRIGQAVARRAAVFGLKVAYFGPHPKPEVSYPYFADVKELAGDSDFLVLTCPGGEATRNLISAEVIRALGPQGALINVSRGSVVDEPALLQALQDGTLGKAGLDVFADEPRVPEAFFALDNVTLLPHIGSATHETRAAMGQVVLDNLAAYFAGKPLPTRVA